MTVVLLRSTKNYLGVAADVKPSGAPAGSTFVETDTGARFVYDGSAWVRLQGGTP